ncbi:hypothetical protein H9P43_000678 [Blastocladiella emersonii ATCC 22665]|nr:hypothetical protein H9P43_000650 [Blastocladiella emersonii ATCC 22665]KAI9189247.1 hypothetical protein H9P43_000678 [Blastocladiella emersonii ATCC 22665]
MSPILSIMSLPTGIRARAPVFSTSSTRTAPMAAPVPSKNLAAASVAVAPNTFLASASRPTMAAKTQEQQIQPLAYHVGNLADSGVLATTPTHSAERIQCDSPTGSKFNISNAAGVRRVHAHATAAAAAVRHAAQSASYAVRRAAVGTATAGNRAASRLGQLLSSRRCSQQRQAAPLTGLAATLESMARNGDPLACPGVCGERPAEIDRLFDEYKLGSARFFGGASDQYPDQSIWEHQALGRVEEIMPAVLLDFLGPQLAEFRAKQALSPAAIQQIAAVLREHREVYQHIAPRFDPANDKLLPREVPRDMLLRSPLLRSAMEALDAKITPMLRCHRRRSEPQQQGSGGSSVAETAFRTEQQAADFWAYMRYMGRVHDAHVQFGNYEAGIAARNLASLAVLHLTGVDVYEGCDYKAWERQPAVDRDASEVLYYLFAFSRIGF